MNTTKRVKEALSKVLMLVVALCVGFASVFYLDGQASVAPDNPINGLLESDWMSVAEATTLEVDEEVLDQNADITDASSEVLSDQIGVPEVTTGQGTPKPSGGGAGTAGATLPTNVPYFRTSLQEDNGKRVDSKTDSRSFDFWIEHLREEYPAVGITFYTNGEVDESFSGDVQGGTFDLQDGANVVFFDIQYQLSDGSTNTVRSREYTLHYIDVDTEIVIKVEYYDTDSESGDGAWREVPQNGLSVEDPSLVLRVSTNPGEVDLCEVDCNGARLAADDGRYNAHLSLGNNTIKVYADSAGRTPQTRELSILYEKGQLSLDTDLVYHQATSPTTTQELSFYVRVLGETSPNLRVNVYFNGKHISPTEASGTDYAVTLALGANTFQVVVDDYEHQVIDRTYYVSYKRSSDGGDNPEGPAVKSDNVSDGMIVNSAVFSYQISAWDHQGREIYTNGQYIKLNGVICRISEVKLGVYFYNLYLNEGENLLEVEIRDYDEYYTRYTYKIIYQPSNEREPNGTVSVTVDASTVGLGVLASGAVSNYADEPASYALVRLLESQGYTCTISGSMNYTMYLKYINKPGITNGWNVPPDLQDELTGWSPDAWHGEYYTDSLGEQNFTSASGWMISINGAPMGSSLSNTYLSPGDTITVRFTLANGNDIGQGSQNFSKVW